MTKEKVLLQQKVSFKVCGIHGKHMNQYWASYFKIGMIKEGGDKF